MVFVTSTNGKLYGLDQTSGDMLWSYEAKATAEPALSGQKGIERGPVLGGGAARRI